MKEAIELKRIFSVLFMLALFFSFPSVSFALSEPVSNVGTVTIYPSDSYVLPDTDTYMDYTKTIAATATASDSYGENYTAENIIDGIETSFWLSTNRNADFVVDLGLVAKINNVQWYFSTDAVGGAVRYGTFGQFKLQYSTDGDTYYDFMTCDLTRTDYSGGNWIDIKFNDAIDIRYIKYLKTNTSPTSYAPVALEMKAWGAINEKYILPDGVTDKDQLNGIEYVYDRSAAVTTPEYISNELIDYTKEAEASASATASYGTGHYGPLNVLSSAVDNQWTGIGEATTKELIVDLGQTANIEYIEWYTPGGSNLTNDQKRASNCILEYSSNGTDYISFYKRQGAPAENSWTEMKFKNPIPIRYIKYTSLDSTAGAAWNIKVWGEASADGPDEYLAVTAVAHSGAEDGNFLSAAVDGSYSTYYISKSVDTIPWVQFNLNKSARIDKVRVVPHQKEDSYDSLGDFAVYGVSGNELYLLNKVDGQILKINRFNDLEIQCDRAFNSILIAKTNDAKTTGALSFCEIRVVEDTSINSVSSLYKKNDETSLTLTSNENVITYQVYSYTPVEKVTEKGKYEVVCTYRNNTQVPYIHPLIGSFGSDGKLLEYSHISKLDAANNESQYVASDTSGSFVKEYEIIQNDGITAIKAVITARAEPYMVPLLNGDIIDAVDVLVDLPE